jgi:ankyrin repeat protein
MDIDDLKLVLLNSDLSALEAALIDFDINSFDKNGNNILHYFVKSHESVKIPAESIIQLLIDCGVDVNTRQSKMPKRTALHFAVINKAKHVFDVLINKGADVNIQDGDGKVALSEAVFWYRDDDGYFIETLLSKGARGDIANNWGVTPKGLAETVTNYDLKKFFV